MSYGRTVYALFGAAFLQARRTVTKGGVFL